MDIQISNDLNWWMIKNQNPENKKCCEKNGKVRKTEDTKRQTNKGVKQGETQENI